MAAALLSTGVRGEENRWLLLLISTVPGVAQATRYRPHFALPADNPCRIQRLDPPPALPPGCLFSTTCSRNAITYSARSARAASGPSIRLQIRYLVTGLWRSRRWVRAI